MYFGLASYSSSVITVACLFPKKFPVLRFGGAVAGLTLSLVFRDCQVVCQNMETHFRSNVIKRIFIARSERAIVQKMTMHTVLGPTVEAYLEKKLKNHYEKKINEQKKLL